MDESGRLAPRKLAQRRINGGSRQGVSIVRHPLLGDTPHRLENPAIASLRQQPPGSEAKELHSC